MRILTSALLLATLACGDPADAPLRAVLEADDRRAATATDRAALVSGLRSADATVRRFAVRALGRLERAEHVDAIAALIPDEDASVRREAATALAQTLSRASTAASALAPLVRLLTSDPDETVRAAAATSLGRLPYASTAERREAGHLLVAASTESGPGGTPPQDAPDARLLGIARGLEALGRGADDALAAATIERLRELAEPPTSPTEIGRTRVRRLAVAALVRSGALRTGDRMLALADPDAEVRRLAAGATTGDGDDDLTLAALQDTSARVRTAALQALARGPATGAACERYAALLLDAAPPMQLVAIDALSRCPSAADGLAGLASATPSAPGSSWHVGAHALAALARAAPERAGALVDRRALDRVWQTRAYTARAAATLGDVDLLAQLASDPHPNVAHAALTALDALEARGPATLAATEALARDDYQLLIAAATILRQGTATSLERLAAALERLTAVRSPTSRDPRSALLTSIGALGDATQASRIAPYLSDFDPAIAELAATILERWTGERPAATPQPLPAAPFPTLDELRELEATQVVLQLRGGRVVLRLFPFEAPTNATRFARLARAGTYDGLTFHRVVPNFVVQGGSPGANEYAGHDPYTRDEITDRSHLRGTVGVSTRGRDTGDGQIFINLVDNVRLDFNYTIFAEVIEGMEIVEAMVEGASIAAVVFEPLQNR